MLGILSGGGGPGFEKEREPRVLWRAAGSSMKRGLGEEDRNRRRELEVDGGNRVWERGYSPAEESGLS